MSSRASRSGGKPFSANRTRVDSANKTSGGQAYPEIKQRGYYSDIIGTDGSDGQLDYVLNGPTTAQDTLWNVAKEKHTPKVTAFEEKGNVIEQIKGQSHGPSTEITAISDFSKSSSEPKVQLPFYTKPGDCPRKIEVERRRRLYSTIELKNLLKDQGIKTDQLMPKQTSMPVQINMDPNDPAPFPAYLPLHLFDNEEHDCRLPTEWLKMGQDNGTRKPVPALALLPSKDTDKELDPTDPKIKYEWTDVGILDYDPKQQLFFVQKCNSSGRIVDESGKAVVNGGFQSDGSRMDLKNQFWVHRVRLMLKAEDPRIFAQRVAEAFRLRKETEAILRYNLYVDCMPMDGVGELDQASLRRMVECAKNSPGLGRDKNLEDYIQVLEKEVNIDFCWSMNRIIFDKTVDEDPVTFAFVTKPEKKEELVPVKGCVLDVPEYPYDQNYDQFAFHSLLTRKESIEATGKVRTECNKVCGMSLFHIPTTKPMRLEEFEQTQSQATSQVSLFLKDSWITVLRTHIRTSLRDVGKGWFNIHETNWEVYQISKLKAFMEMVKFIMQDSMRYLIQESLLSFTQMVIDACHSALTLEEEFVWGGDFIMSPFKPKRNALFLVDLMLDNLGAHYSTNLNSFESMLVGLFDKGIQSTQQIPQLEKYILEDITWSGTPLLESVGEHEPFVEELRDNICNSIRKAVIPMKAYAKEYEKHLELMNTDINKYVEEYDAQEHTAQEVKDEVELHLKEREILENALPTNVVIGPFWVNTDQVKQKLCKKRKELSLAVLELLAKKLRKQADDACESFKDISRKLYDKCNCIEELSDMREWMKGIPEKIKEHQEQIDKAMEDYELIEEFYYNLSQDDFNAKWTAIAWPHKIERQMEATYTQLEEDEERFRKLQTSDQANFNDRLDTLQMVVAGMAAHTDISRAQEIANEVRRINKQLKEAQTLAQTYNNRERLFGQPVTNYDKLGKLVKDFEPFRNLWLTASDWLRWHESWMNDPLETINAEEVEKNVNDSYKTMHKSNKVFAEMPGVQQVAAEIKANIEDFKPFIPLIQGLRNPGMRNRHWEQVNIEQTLMLSEISTKFLINCCVFSKLYCTPASSTIKNWLSRNSPKAGLKIGQKNTKNLIKSNQICIIC